MTELTNQQEAKLDALKNLPDDLIDTSDIPEMPINSAKAIRGAFYQPVKCQVTVELEEYVIRWFKESAGTERDYQEDINQVLMDYIQRQRILARKSATKPSRQ